MEKSKIIALGKDVLKNKVYTDFSKDSMEEKLREQFATLCTDSEGKFNAHRFQENKELMFELMEEIVDEVLPTRIEELMGLFADVMTFDDGDKPRFKLKKGRKNVRRFVTKVAPAGVYNRVKLATNYVDMDMEALGGAVFIPFEDYVAGDMTLEDVLTAMLDELQDKIYEEVQLAIQNTYTALPAANKHSAASLVEDEMKRVLDTVNAYGKATIFCTPEFARTLVPSSGFLAETDKTTLNEFGFLGTYYGSPIIVMPQSFEDLDNVTKVFDPQYAYIVPAGSDEQVVKLGFEGQTHMRDMQQKDWSFEIQMYKKYGISVLNTNFYGIYRNTAL